MSKSLRSAVGKQCLLLALAVLATGTVLGQAIRLDIGPAASTTAPGWLAWRVPRGDGAGPFQRKIPALSWAPDGLRITLGPAKAFGCRTGPKCTGPEAPVIEESVFTHARTPMTIQFSGLSVGSYRVILWLNDARGHQWPELRLDVTNATGTKQLLPDQGQSAVTDTRKTSKADVVLNVKGEEDILLTATIPPIPKTYVFLSGIEILPAEYIGKALHPLPENGAVEQVPDGCLSWDKVPGATCYRLWHGQSPQSLRLAKPDPLTGTSHILPAIRFSNTLYWRIDTLRKRRFVRGDVWQFTTASGEARGASPPDGAVGVKRAPLLSWKPVKGATAYLLLTGASPETLKVVGKVEGKPAHQLEEVPWGATVFWRVDAITPLEDKVQGRVWQFRADRGKPRAPQPPHGAMNVGLDTQLAWNCPRTNAVFTVWSGAAPDQLKPLAKGLAHPRTGIVLTPGENMYWRVEAQCGDQILSSPVWQFTIGSTVLIDDFEDTNILHPLADAWDDGRATDPNAGPAIALAAGVNGAMQVRLSDGARTLTKSCKEHPDWTMGGVARLSLKLRGAPGNAPVSLRLRLRDTQGKAVTLPLSAPDGWHRRNQWVTVRIALPVDGGIDCQSMAALSLIATADGEAIFCVDDIVLEASEDIENLSTEGARTGRLTSIREAPPAPRPTPSKTIFLRSDVCVVGGGSGGIGAAAAAARGGASVLLIEREAMLGGTSTSGGVASWEPGPGCSIARELFERMQRYRNGIISDKRTYDETLTRAGNGHIQFDPPVFHDAASTMLRETGLCRVLLNTTFVESLVHPKVPRVVEIRATSADGTLYRIRSRFFIDCTGSGFLCQTAGCETMLGADSADRFGEPGAPDKHHERLNALELVYRIRPSADPVRQPLPEGMAPRGGGAAWPQPSGQRFMNTCGGLAPGWLLTELGYEGARRELERRALAHWHRVQHDRYPGYEFDSFSPMLAIRESHRVVGEYVLTQHDLLAGIAKQQHSDIIAIADHPMDTHGSGGGLGRVAAPYGIPFRCLVPKGGWTNLLIACRGASFSHIAASSCRLSRTMMALGHAAGLAAAHCVEKQTDIAALDIQGIQKSLGMPPETGRISVP